MANLAIIFVSAWLAVCEYTSIYRYIDDDAKPLWRRDDDEATTHFRQQQQQQYRSVRKFMVTIRCLEYCCYHMHTFRQFVQLWGAGGMEPCLKNRTYLLHLACWYFFLSPAPPPSEDTPAFCITSAVIVLLPCNGGNMHFFGIYIIFVGNLKKNLECQFGQPSSVWSFNKGFST